MIFHIFHGFFTAVSWSTAWTQAPCGTVRFVGLTSFAEGQWVGVELDDARGKNDGSVPLGTRKAGWCHESWEYLRKIDGKYRKI
jgi:hypothetical protein